MKWNAGHVWVLTLELSTPEFEFKYVVKSDKEAIWESGDNRLCVLPDSESSLVLDSVWNSYKANFAIYFPLKDPDEGVYMVGDIDQLGKWYTIPPVCPMHLGAPRKVANTGEEAVCWECELILPNTLREFGYKYVVYNRVAKSLTMEREVGRYFHLARAGSESYHEFTMKSQQQQDSYEYNRLEMLTNGRVQRFDVNMALEGLLFDEVVKDTIFVGPYPQNERDVRLIKDKATALLNLQTERDFKQRMIDIEKTEKWVTQNGMRLLRYPITDFDPMDLASKVKNAADALKKLIDEGNKVYVHCTAGMGRAASVVVMYLTLYGGMTPEDACKFVKEKRKAATPNMGAIANALKLAGKHSETL